MLNEIINFEKKFQLFSDKWAPKIVAQMNDYHFKLARVEGDFTWHDHKNTDEVYIILEGTLRIDFEGGSQTLQEGELLVIPKGVQHKPYAEKECKILIIEPEGTINTGDTGGKQTAANNVWI